MKTKNESVSNSDELKQLVETLRSLIAEIKAEKSSKPSRGMFKRWKKRTRQDALPADDVQPPSPACTPSEDELPPCLATPEAMILWQKAQEHEWVDEHYRPLFSHTFAALLARRMASLLHIKNKWKVFGDYWHINDLRKYRYRGDGQYNTVSFIEELKELNCQELEG